jgi:hypothetical protein
MKIFLLWITIRSRLIALIHPNLFHSAIGHRPAVKNLLLLMLLLALGITACGGGSGDPYEGGRYSTSPSGSFYIVALKGTFRQMGRQYGLILRDQLQAFYKEAAEDFMIGLNGATYADLLANGQANYNAYPQIFKDFLDGSAETNGLGRDKTYILSSMFILIMRTGSGCSSLSAWGDYTPDRATVVGRNLDLAAANLRRFSKYFHVVVWNPTGYAASVANIDFMGSIFYQTAINSKGIFLELQNGQMSDTSEVLTRENTNDLLLKSLFYNLTSADVDNWFQTTMPQFGLIMNASFPDHTTIYEWSPTWSVKARNANGLISASNDFIDPSWTDPPIHLYASDTADTADTVARRTNLLALGELNKGNITPQRMMEIFDKTLTDSPAGATFPEGGEFKTIYSIVVQPSTLKIWLKVREYSGWEEISLGPYFSSN